MGSDAGIEHDREGHRFTTEVDGHRASVDYRLEDSRMIIVHSGVPKPIEGRGIAATLMRAALDAARAEGWRVVPQCAYAADFVRRHAEYADLVGGS